jgi:D,D-heptose 1,7-bisphosphate phosphatase
LNKAIFLDRDGTLIKEVNYLTKKNDIQILEGVKEALSCFKKLGFLNIVITNQSAVARGYLTEKVLKEIHSDLLNKLNTKKTYLLNDIFYSPFHRDGVIKKYSKESFYRKPGTGLILKAALIYNINLDKSFFIGDSLVDMQCAENMKLKKILVLTGYGKKAITECKKNKIKIDYVASDLLDASKFIKKYLEF